MKCVIFEPVSVVKNGIEEAVIASGSTVKWSEIKITQEILFGETEITCELIIVQ